MTTWLDAAYGQYAVTQSTIKVWRELVEDLVPPILSFLNQSPGGLLEQGLDYFNKVDYDIKYVSSTCRCGHIKVCIFANKFLGIC